MLDSKLQESLRMKFNPDGSDMRKLQLRMLDMLKFIDEICNKHNIKYWLSSGTCLGAVRHGGFIPWDDDCDIEMLQSDYKKLVKVMNKEKNPKYLLQTYKNDISFFPRFGKFRDRNSTLLECGYDRKHKYNGIYVDVFPIRPSSSEYIHKCGNFPLWLLTFRGPKLYVNKPITKIVQFASQCIVSTIGFILNSLQCIGKKKYLRHVSPNYFAFPRVYSEIFPLTKIEF